MKKPPITTAAVALFVALSGTPAARAADGMQVTKDPVTGELRLPTADEAKALRAAKAAPKTVVRRGLATGAINPQPVAHANGMVSLELDEDSLTYSVARRNADGSISQVCVTGAANAARAMKGGMPAVQHSHVSREVRHEEK